ncbi:LysR substrate-binding domain-containing protein [Paradesertivirga mongoliensis]|uniref:LysR substrate-binding domain-containing protein n=1 Tax=Paradesertivirga mongoliensis TaxID=2100740 RepID=A0ABW4ZH88_9SPHI|nr:hydrogen peroxide-inducible genes activator [Pedobacter mongoliensis]
MTLVQLEYIVAVDTHRNFVLASQSCFVTQPTLSMQIQKLEENLGIKIFDRSRQPVVPTEIGQQVIAQARIILNESRQLTELIKVFNNELSGELKIGVIPTVAPYLLPQIIPGFSKKYPKVQLMIWEYTTEQIIQNLKVGLLDCGILATPLEEPTLFEIPLFYESFVVYLSSSSPLMKKKEISNKDIDFDELWLLNEGHCMRNQVLNICQRKKAGESNKQFEYNTGSVETLKRMVDLNSGITILPELSLKDLSEEQISRSRRFVSPVPVREISIVTHRNFLKRGVIKALENEILEAVPKEMHEKNKRKVLDTF